MISHSILNLLSRYVDMGSEKYFGGIWSGIGWGRVLNPHPWSRINAENKKTTREIKFGIKILLLGLSERFVMRIIALIPFTFKACKL